MTEQLKLTAYLGERERVPHGPLLADALLDLYAHHGVATSVLFRGAEGFGAHHRLRTDRLLTLSEDLPLVAVAVDEPARIEALGAEVEALMPRGLVLQEGARPAGAELPPVVRLSVFLHRAGAYRDVVATLRRHGVAGATVLLGVDGTVQGERRRARALAPNPSVPVMVLSVGTRESVTAALAGVAAAAPGANVIVEGARLGLPERDGADRDKLTVFTSEQARHDGRPVHLELVRRLRAAGAAGATALRGIWGYHGDHPPHGDRLLAVRRHVPVVTVAVDSPERIARWHAIAAELTEGRGLVMVEPVPRVRARG